jgi:hypothetical protein
MLKDLAQGLEPGKSAILALVEHTAYEQMLEAVDERILNRTYWADDVGRIEL